jgi:sec-independent protein translocase protein TatB
VTPLLLDINGPEFLLLLVLAVILFGPERLPDLARKAARLVRYLRTMAGSAQEQLSRELGPGFEDLDFRDMNPKTFVKKHLLDDVEPIIADVKSEITDVRGTVKDSSADVPRSTNGVKPVTAGGPEDLTAAAEPEKVLTPFDAEAT